MVEVHGARLALGRMPGGPSDRARRCRRLRLRRLPGVPRQPERCGAGPRGTLSGSPGPSRLSAFTLALAGQPNVGKSTVFNALTGLNQHVGNWPGKTVEKKTGHFKHEGRRIEIVDLPGTYSLTSGSEEERVARDYLIRTPRRGHRHRQRRLAWSATSTWWPSCSRCRCPWWWASTWSTWPRRTGCTWRPRCWRRLWACRWWSWWRASAGGCGELVDAAVRVAEQPGERSSPTGRSIRAKHRPVLDADREPCSPGALPAGYPADWVALKLLEGDADVAALVSGAAPEVWEPIHERAGRARGRLSRHRRRALRLGGADGARGGGAAARAGVTGHHRPHRPGGHASLLGAAGAHRRAGRAVLRHLHGGRPGGQRRSAGDHRGRSPTCCASCWPGRRAGSPGVLVDGVVAGAGTVLVVRAHPGDLLRRAGPAGGRGLHGPHRLRHGPLHALDGSARQVVHAAAAGFRLQRARRPGHAHHRGRAGRACSP